MYYDFNTKRQVSSKPNLNELEQRHYCNRYIPAYAYVFNKGANIVVQVLFCVRC